MAYKFKRKYFKKRRAFTRRKYISKRFNFRKYMSRRPKSPEIKYASKVFNETITFGTTKTAIMHAETIPSGTKNGEHIGGFIKTRYLTVRLNMYHTDGVNNVGTNYLSRFRISILKPRCSETDFNSHLTAVGNLGTWDPMIVRVFYDDFVFLEIAGPDNISSAKGYWKYKKAIKYPCKVQLRDTGQWLDFKDQVFIRIVSLSNNNSTYTIYGFTKLSYTDA